MRDEITETQDQSRNGVKVVVTKYFDKKGPSGSRVEASCSCFGSPHRVHDDPYCPLFREQEKENHHV